MSADAGETFNRLHGFIGTPDKATSLTWYIRKRLLSVIPTSGKKGLLSTGKGQLGSLEFKQTFTHGPLHIISSPWERARQCNTSGKWASTEEVSNAKQEFLLRGEVLLMYPEVIESMRRSLEMDPRWQCDAGGGKVGVRAPCPFCKTNAHVDPSTKGFEATMHGHDPTSIEDIFGEIYRLSRVYLCSNPECPEVTPRVSLMTCLCMQALQVKRNEGKAATFRMYTEGMLELMPRDVAAVFDYVQVSPTLSVTTRAKEAFEDSEVNQAAWTRWAAGRKKSMCDSACSRACLYLHGHCL